MGRDISERLELDLESYNSANTNGSIRQPQFSGYLGMQFLFSMKYKKEGTAETGP